MEIKDNKVKFTDDQGRITELNILFTYDDKDSSKTYVFFYADETPDEIIAGYLGENNEILDIENDDEYDKLDEVLDSFYKENKQA